VRVRTILPKRSLRHGCHLWRRQLHRVLRLDWNLPDGISQYSVWSRWQRLRSLQRGQKLHRGGVHWEFLLGLCRHHGQMLAWQYDANLRAEWRAVSGVRHRGRMYSRCVYLLWLPGQRRRLPTRHVELRVRSQRWWLPRLRSRSKLLERFVQQLVHRMRERNWLPAWEHHQRMRHRWWQLLAMCDGANVHQWSLRRRDMHQRVH